MKIWLDTGLLHTGLPVATMWKEEAPKFDGNSEREDSSSDVQKAGSATSTENFKGDSSIDIWSADFLLEIRVLKHVMSMFHPVLINTSCILAGVGFRPHVFIQSIRQHGQNGTCKRIVV